MTLLQVLGLMLAVSGVAIISSINYVLALFQKKNCTEKNVEEILIVKSGPKE